MKENKLHFLDTSVILTGLTKWKKEEFFHIVNEYFKDSEFKKLTSIRVFSEAQNVINNSRRIISQFLQNLFENPSCINPMNVQNSLISHAKQLFNEKFEQRIIISFIKINSDEIFNAINSRGNIFENYSKNIRKEIETALLTLIILCQPKQDANISRYDKCPTDYSRYYPNEFGQLQKFINYQKDTEVILDSFFISKKISKKVSLITLDKEHMLSNKQHIEATLQTIKVCDFRNYQ